MPALRNLLKFSLIPILATASLSAATTHKVQPGDTLSSIARRNGTTASKLMSANGITDAKLLKVGQVLTISGSSSGSSQPKPSASSSAGGNSHSVKSGETLYSISRSSGVSVSRLTALNPGLDPSKLKIGQRIRTGGAPAPTPQKPKPAVASTPKPVQKPAPKPAQAPRVAPKPTPAVARQPVPTSSSKPIAASTPKPVVKERKEVAKQSAPAPSKIASVLVEKEISFGALASKHRTSTQQLNELNGLSLKATTVLAKGSEIYVPGL